MNSSNNNKGDSGCGDGEIISSKSSSSSGGSSGSSGGTGVGVGVGACGGIGSGEERG